MGALDEFPCEFGGGGEVLDEGFAFDVGHRVVETLLVLVVLVFFLEFVLEFLVLFGALLVLVSHHFRLQILVEILLLILLQFLRNLFLRFLLVPLIILLPCPRCKLINFRHNTRVFPEMIFEFFYFLLDPEGKSHS